MLTKRLKRRAINSAQGATPIRLIALLCVICSCAACHGVGPNRQARACEHEEVGRVGNVTIRKVVGEETLLFTAGMSIEADGAPNAYHPDDTPGLDALANAGKPGNWWALVTDNGRPNGQPLIQGSPASERQSYPGFYISTTALFDARFPERDVRRWIDARQVPYFVMPGGRAHGAKKGDLGLIFNASNGRESGAIFADVGDSDRIGEGSIALASRLAVPGSPRSGGVTSGVTYLVFKGSGNGRPKQIDAIETESQRLFETWGGMERLRKCLE